jgi:hypothetical protein
MHSTERRGAERWRADHLEAWLSLNNSLMPRDCRVLNASATGALLETPLFLTRDMRIQLAMSFPDGHNADEVLVRTARVVRQTPSGAAVAFENAA